MIRAVLFDLDNTFHGPFQRGIRNGNDPVNDMVAGRIGMKTYFTTDALHQGSSNLSLSQKIRESERLHEEIRPDFEGPLADLPQAIRLLAGNRSMA